MKTHDAILAEYCVHFLTKPSSRRQGQIRVLFVLQDDVFFCGGLNFHLIMSGFLVSKDAMAVIFKDNVIQLMTLSTFEDVKNTNYSKYFAQENRETPLRFNLKVHRTSFL